MPKTITKIQSTANQLTTRENQEAVPGSIILANLKQANGEQKQRPAIVLTKMPSYGDLLVCGISSQLWQEIPDFDEILTPNTINQLKVESVIRLGFLEVIPANQIGKIIGRIPDTLHTALLWRLIKFLGRQTKKGNSG